MQVPPGEDDVAEGKVARKVPREVARKVPKAGHPEEAENWTCQKCGYLNAPDDNRCANCGESDPRAFYETLRRLNPSPRRVRRAATHERPLSTWKLIFAIIGITGIVLSALGFQFSAGFYFTTPADVAPLVCGAFVLLLLGLFIGVRLRQQKRPEP